MAFMVNWCGNASVCVCVCVCVSRWMVPGRHGGGGAGGAWAAARRREPSVVATNG